MLWLKPAPQSAPPFNNLKCIEKASADALHLWGSTLALGLVEEGILVWAPELVSFLVLILLRTQGCTYISVHTQIHTRI